LIAKSLTDRAPEIVSVNWRGENANGDSYLHRVQPAALRSGLMTEQKVLIQYPDRRIDQGYRIKITPKGMEEIRKAMPVEVREPEGRE